MSFWTLFVLIPGERKLSNNSTEEDIWEFLYSNIKNLDSARHKSTMHREHESKRIFIDIDVSGEQSRISLGNMNLKGTLI